jgi:multiple sugar transport system permease protein
LRPIFLFVLVMLTVYAFQVFDQIYIMTRGGPDYSTYVTVFYIYEKAFKFLDFGYSSAMSVLLFIIIFAVSLMQMKFMRGGKID